MKTKYIFLIFSLSLASGCSSNNQDGYTYNVYEKDERYLLADIPDNEVHINVSFSYTETPSEELNAKYIKELGLRKYKDYLVPYPYSSSIITYKFAINKFKERDKKFFESLRKSDLISDVSIYYFKEYGALAKINNDYYGFNEENNIDYTMLDDIKFDAGIFSTKDMLENALEKALIDMKIQANQLQTILDKYPDSFFNENILIALGTSTSGSISNKHTLYDVYLKDNTIYGLVEMGYPDPKYYVFAQTKYLTHCISVSKDYLESINKIELLYCPYTRLDLIRA